MSYYRYTRPGHPSDGEFSSLDKPYGDPWPDNLSENDERNFLTEVASDDVALIGSLKRSLRAQRNVLLIASDWTQMPDAPLTEQERAAWKAYRQELRDLPQQFTDANNPPPLPTPPV